MTEQELHDLVTWRVDATPPAATATTAVKNLVVLVASAVLSGSVGEVTHLRARRLPDEADAPVGLVEAQGSAPWLPTTYAHEQVLLTLYRDRATANPTTLPGQEVEVPLADYRLVAARSLAPEPRRREADLWELTVEGPDTALALRGAWIDLAWAGRIAGWPDPDDL